MQLTIYRNSVAVGTAEISSNGLYWEIICNIDQRNGELSRLYAVEGWRSEYLGIPDSQGTLHSRIGKCHLPEGITFIVATSVPRGEWLPWRGVVDGVTVEECLMRPEEAGFSLALSEEESVKFPEWVEQMEKQQVYGKNLALLRLDTEGHLPVLEEVQEEDGIAHEEAATDIPSDVDVISLS